MGWTVDWWHEYLSIMSEALGSISTARKKKVFILPPWHKEKITTFCLKVLPILTHVCVCMSVWIYVQYAYLLRLEVHVLHPPLLLSVCSSEAGSLSEPRPHILAHVKAGKPSWSSRLLPLRAEVTGIYYKPTTSSLLPGCRTRNSGWPSLLWSAALNPWDISVAPTSQVYISTLKEARQFMLCFCKWKVYLGIILDLQKMSGRAGKETQLSRWRHLLPSLMTRGWLPGICRVQRENKLLRPFLWLAHMYCSIYTLPSSQSKKKW
jgi:hypothetical protein